MHFVIQERSPHALNCLSILGALLKAATDSVPSIKSALDRALQPSIHFSKQGEAPPSSPKAFNFVTFCDILSSNMWHLSLCDRDNDVHYCDIRLKLEFHRCHQKLCKNVDLLISFKFYFQPPLTLFWFTLLSLHVLSSEWKKYLLASFLFQLVIKTSWRN